MVRSPEMDEAEEQGGYFEGVVDPLPEGRDFRDPR